ncbi:hypothetical protein MM188_003174 [Vibrio cholerae]|nr:hypothetical protein [Vibrio cholerae]
MTERIRSFIVKKLKDSLDLKIERVRVGQHFEYHYSINNIDPKLSEDERREEIVRRAHTISRNLREWKDAIIALNLTNHLLDRNLAQASKNLSEFIPEFDQLMAPSMDAATLRDNWKILYKNERRTKQRKAVLAALQDIRYEHHAYYIIQPIYVWARKMGTSNDEVNRTSRVKNQIKINPDYALKVAHDLLKKNIEAKPEDADKYELAIGLAIATGRRRTEIFKTAHFDRMSNTPEGHVIFSGQLKTKDRGLFNDVKPYPIPCLVDVDLVMDGMKRLRSIQKDDRVRYLDARGNNANFGVLEIDQNDQYHNQAVKGYYSHTANDRIRILFDAPLMEFRYTRDMYSEIGYDRFKHDGEGRSAYRSRVYGHAEGKGDTQRAYEKFELSRAVERADIVNVNQQQAAKGENREIVKKLKALTPKIREEWKRSPNGILIHEWLTEQLDTGLKASDVSATFIKRHFLPSGKVLNIRTINEYLNTWANWDELKQLAIEPEELDDVESDVSDEELDDEIDGLETQDDEDSEDNEIEAEQEAQPVQEKPTIGCTAHSMGWDVTVRLGEHTTTIGISHDEANSKITAMHAAWAYYEWLRTLPEKPLLKTEKKGEEWHTVFTHGQLSIEHVGVGNKLEHQRHVINAIRRLREALQSDVTLRLNQTYL